MKNLSIILPYKSDNGYHEMNFKYVYKLLKSQYPDGEIIIGEDKTGGDLFNRSNAVNNGVAESSREFVMLYDVDVILPKSNVIKSMKVLFWLLAISQP